MFIAIGVMFLGLSLGFLLRGRPRLAILTRCVTPAIMLLLFSLGVAVGGNEILMSNLPALGGKALFLTLAGVVGSLVCVAVIRPCFRDFSAAAETGRRTDAPRRAEPREEPGQNDAQSCRRGGTERA